jgi:metal-responsive CopG/Arc/MetJ family transcriptional regulator
MDRKPVRFEIRLPPALADEIDGWRRKQADIPPRAEAARRLIELGLKADKQPEED